MQKKETFLSKLDDNELYEKVFVDSTTHQKVEKVIGQLKEKLDENKRRTYTKLEELNEIVGRLGEEDSSQKKVDLWRDKYNIDKELKDDRIFSKIRGFIRNWGM